MKTLPRLILAGCALLAVAAFTPGARAAVYMNQNFEGYPPGPLTSGSGLTIGSGISGAIVSSGGSQALQLSRTAIGSASYTTNGGPNTPLTLSADTSFQWSFQFRIDSATPQSNTAGSFILLDTTGSGSSSTFAGLRVYYSGTSKQFEVYYYSVLNGSFSSQTSYTLLGALNTDQWYTATFDLTLDGSAQVAYNVSVGAYSGSVATQTSNAGLGGANYVRMSWSPQVNGSVMQYDNLFIGQAIPEPGSTALLLGGLCIVGAGWARKVRKS